MEEGNSTAANTLGKHTFSLDSLEDCPSTPVSASSGFASGAIVTGSALQGKKMITVFFPPCSSPSLWCPPYHHRLFKG